MKRKTFRPEVDIKRRPKSAGARRPKTPQRPATRDGRRAIESGTRDLSAETKEILRGGYTLNDKQKEGILSAVPMKRMGSGDDIASAVTYLASNEASYVTGQTLHVNGGMVMV